MNDNSIKKTVDFLTFNIVLFILSFTAIFAFFNILNYDLPTLLNNNLEEISEIYINYFLLLTNFSFAFVINSIYWKNQKQLYKHNMFYTFGGFTLISTFIYTLWIQSYFYPIVGLLLILNSFLVFNIAFQKYGNSLLFLTLLILGILGILIDKENLSNELIIFSILQLLTSIGVFLKLKKSILKSLKLKKEKELDDADLLFY